MRTLVWMVIGGCVAGACGEVKSGDDADPTPADAAPAAEVCAPGNDGPVDEDMDGDVDEGCPWSFGKPHVLAPFAGERDVVTEVDPNWVSPDGLRLYMAIRSGDVRRAWVATRTTTKAPFGPAVLLAGDDLGSYRVYSFTLSSDEREAYFAARTSVDGSNVDIYRATRTDPTESFGPLTPVPGVSTGDVDERPQLRADGLELLVVSKLVLRRSLRISASDAFATAEVPQGLPPGNKNGPFLSRDGRTLFYYHVQPDSPLRIHRAERDNPALATFTERGEVAELDPGR
jgi:hypothetical protein